MLINKFKDLSVSRSTIHKIYSKILNYSYKRISRDRVSASFSRINIMKRLIFIKKYLDVIDDNKTITIIIDEAGKYNH